MQRGQRIPNRAAHDIRRESASWLLTCRRVLTEFFQILVTSTVWNCTTPCVFVANSGLQRTADYSDSLQEWQWTSSESKKDSKSCEIFLWRQKGFVFCLSVRFESLSFVVVCFRVDLAVFSNSKSFVSKILVYITTRECLVDDQQKGPKKADLWRPQLMKSKLVGFPSFFSSLQL